MIRHRSIIHLLVVAGIVLFIGGCSYFNTFYNAKKQFKAAEKETEQRQRQAQAPASGGQSGASNQSGQSGRSSTSQTPGPIVAADKYRKVIETSSKLLEYYPNSNWVPDALFIMGISYYRLGDLPRAERKFTELITLFPNSKLIPSTLIWKGRVLVDEKNPKDAMDFLLRGIEKSRDAALKAEAYLLLGRISFDQKNFTDAEGYYKSAAESYSSRSDRVDALYQYGIACFEARNFESASDAFSRVVRQTRDVGRAYDASIYWSKSEVGLNHYEQAESILLRVQGSERFFDYVDDVSLELAQLAVSSNHIDDGIQQYQAFIESRENSERRGLAFYRLALIHRDHRIDLPLAKSLLDSAQRAGASREIADSARIALLEISRGLVALEKIKVLEVLTDSLRIQLDSAGAPSTDSSLLAYARDVARTAAKPKHKVPIAPTPDMKPLESPKLADLGAPGGKSVPDSGVKGPSGQSPRTPGDTTKLAAKLPDHKAIPPVKPAVPETGKPAKHVSTPRQATASDSDRTWASAVLVFRSLSFVERAGFRTLVSCIECRDSARDAGDQGQEQKAQTVINRAYGIGGTIVPAAKPGASAPREPAKTAAADSLPKMVTPPALTDSQKIKPQEPSDLPKRSREDSPGGASPEWLAALAAEDTLKAVTPPPGGSGPVLTDPAPPAVQPVKQSNLAADSILRALAKRDSMKADSAAAKPDSLQATPAGQHKADSTHPAVDPVVSMKSQLIAKQRELQAAYLQTAEFYLYNLSEPDSAMRYFRLAASSRLNASVFWRANLYLAYRTSPKDSVMSSESEAYYRAVVDADSVPVDAANLARQALNMPLLALHISEQDSLFNVAEQARLSNLYASNQVLHLYSMTASLDSTSKTGIKSLVSKAYIFEYDLHQPDSARVIYEHLQTMNPDTALSAWIRGKLSTVDSTSVFNLTDEQLLGKTQPLESLLEMKPDSSGWPPPESALRGRRFR